MLMILFSGHKHWVLGDYIWYERFVISTGTIRKEYDISFTRLWSPVSLSTDVNLCLSLTSLFNDITISNVCDLCLRFGHKDCQLGRMHTLVRC